jgi:hypothetical protein
MLQGNIPYNQTLGKIGCFIYLFLKGELPAWVVLLRSLLVKGLCELVKLTGWRNSNLPIKPWMYGFSLYLSLSGAFYKKNMNILPTITTARDETAPSIVGRRGLNLIPVLQFEVVGPLAFPSLPLCSRSPPFFLTFFIFLSPAYRPWSPS